MPPDDRSSHTGKAAPALDGDPAISTIVQAVQFWMTVDNERIKALVLAEFLMQQFGASDTPAGWIAAFDAHRGEIVASALRCHEAGKGVVIVSKACF